MKITWIVCILVALLLLSGSNDASSKSEGNAPKGSPPAISSAGAASSTKSQRNPIEHSMKMLDTDQDGKIGHSEYMAPYENRFKETDTNNDGFLTNEELMHTWKKRMEKRRQRHD